MKNALTYFPSPCSQQRWLTLGKHCCAGFQFATNVIDEGVRAAEAAAAAGADWVDLNCGCPIYEVRSLEERRPERENGSLSDCPYQPHAGFGWPPSQCLQLAVLHMVLSGAVLSPSSCPTVSQGRACCMPPPKKNACSPAPSLTRPAMPVPAGHEARAGRRAASQAYQACAAGGGHRARVAHPAHS